MRYRVSYLPITNGGRVADQDRAVRGGHVGDERDLNQLEPDLETKVDQAEVFQEFVYVCRWIWRGGCQRSPSDEAAPPQTNATGTAP